MGISHRLVVFVGLSCVCLCVVCGDPSDCHLDLCHALSTWVSVTGWCCLLVCLVYVCVLCVVILLTAIWISATRYPHGYQSQVGAVCWSVLCMFVCCVW